MTRSGSWSEEQADEHLDRTLMNAQSQAVAAWTAEKVGGKKSEGQCDWQKSCKHNIIVDGLPGITSEKVVMDWGQRGWKKNITSRFEQAITRKVASTTTETTN